MLPDALIKLYVMLAAVLLSCTYSTDEAGLGYICAPTISNFTSCMSAPHIHILVTFYQCISPLTAEKVEFLIHMYTFCDTNGSAV